MADLERDADVDASVDEASLGDLAAAVNRHNDQWYRPDRPWSPAGVLARVGAAAIDVVLIVALAVVVSIGLAYTTGGPTGPGSEWVFQLIFEAFVCLYLAVDIRGRTLGKALVGLYPMSDVPTRSRRPLVTRWALRCLPLFLAMAVAAAALIQDYFAFVPTDFDESIGLHLPLTLVVMLVLMVVPAGAAGQSWYDRVARTGVMRPALGATKVRGFEPIMPPPPPK